MPQAGRQPRPIVELLSLALPTVAQMASYTVMQFIDTWMLSRPHAGGEIAATAAANSGMLNFAALSLGMGTLVLVNTLVSQSFGRRDFRECGRYLWQGVWLALMYGAVLLPLMNLGPQIFRVGFGHAADQANLESAYWRIVIFAAVAKLISMALSQFLLGIDRPRAVLAAAVLGTGINAVVAWCVVLGHGGFRSHGVVGAAWAQNIGVTCEMLTLIVMTLRPSVREHFGAGDCLPRAGHLATLVRVGVPSGLQWFSDVLAWGVFCNGVLAVLGTTAMEANTFMLRYMVASFMPCVGIGVAVTALVGRYIGRGMPIVAARRAHLGFFLSLAYVTACGVVFIAARGPLMRLFTHDPQVVRIGGLYLVCAAIYEIFDALYIIYVGALRGAGDTLRPAVVMTTLCWTVSVAGGYAVARWTPGLGFGGPWYMGCLYGVLVGVYMLVRFVGGQWRDIRLATVSNAPLSSATLDPS